MRKPWTLWTAALLMLALATPGCGGAEDGTFTVGTATAMSGAFFLDAWGNNTTDVDVRMLLHGYSPTVWTKQMQYEVDNTVVKDFVREEMPNRNLRFTITLHEDLNYNTGKPITAVDYVFATLLAAAPALTELGSVSAHGEHIAGYAAYHAGRTDVLSGLRLLDTYVYAVEVDGAFLPHFYEMALLACFPSPISSIAPGYTVRDDGQGAYIHAPDGGRSLPAELLTRTLLDEEEGYRSNPDLTSGPYALEAYDQEKGAAYFQINPYYKGDHTGRRPAIERLALVHVPPEEMADALQNGRVQLLNKCVAASTIDGGLGLVQAGGFRAGRYPRRGLGFLSFACDRGPLQFEAVRKAVAHSLDTQAFCDRFISPAYGGPVYGYYGLGQWMVKAANGEYTPPETDPAALMEWGEITLEGLNRYDKDLDRARALLEQDGWTLDAQGEAYIPGEGAVRHKRVEDALMPLSLRFGKTQGSAAAALLEEMLLPALTSIGVMVETEEIPFSHVLAQYYRQMPRQYDLLQLATNFGYVFEPQPGCHGPAGYAGEDLTSLAAAMTRTQSGNQLEYCREWLAYQTRWNDRLPMLPLYSNEYFDFYTDGLTDYSPEAHIGWPGALMHARYDPAA